MKLRSVAVVWAAGLVMFAGAALAAKNSVEAVAHRVLAENQDSLVLVTAVCKVRVSGDSAGGGQPREQEQPVETTGMIIHDSGMVVCALRTIDPASMVNGMMPGVTLKSEMQDLKVTLGDGTEIPADLVMKDLDLDIAFVRINKDAPEAKGKKFSVLDFRNNGDAAVLDRVIEINRMNAALNRQPCVRIGAIIGITTKPRKLLISDGNWGSCPVFCQDGKLLGVVVNRTFKGPAGIQRTMAIQPAAGILKILDQALKVKVEPKKEDEADEKTQEKTEKSE